MIVKTKDYQKLLIATVCLMISFPPIVLFVNLLCGAIFGADFSLDTLLCYIALVCMVLASMKQIIGSIKIDVLFFVLIFVVAYAISYSFFEENRFYMFTQWNDFNSNPAYQLFAFSLPAYIFMRYITDYDRLYKMLSYFAMSVVLCSLGIFIILVVNDSQPEYMDFSYNMLLSVLFLSVYFFEKKKPLCLIAAIIGIGLVFFAGARGPLMCYCIGLAAYLLMRDIPRSKKIIWIVVLVVLSTIVMLLWQQLLTLLLNFTEWIGIKSRSIEMLINGEFSGDSGRREIQKEIISSFSLFGSGLFGDRVAGSGHYAHNLLLELISQWGVLLGLAFIAVLAILFYHGIRTKNYSMRLIILILLASSPLKLMLSGSYLVYNSSFFLLIGACVNTLDSEPAESAGEIEKPKDISTSRYIKGRKRIGGRREKGNAEFCEKKPASS